VKVSREPTAADLAREPDGGMLAMFLKVHLSGVRGDVLVSLHVRRFDVAWSKEGAEGIYVGANGYGSNAIHRYRNFQKWLAAHDYMRASEVGVSDDGKVGFRNGRHRYAVLRDLGRRTIPAAMSPESVENANRYGYLHHIYAPNRRTVRLELIRIEADALVA
jgi:hypothetical protein